MSESSAALRSDAEILDACCGGRMWWWEKEHPLALYMDKREAPAGSRPHRPNWRCEPDVLADFTAMPFEDDSFRLVLFDPPHVVRKDLLGSVTVAYGALDPLTEAEDLRRGFAECWRVLAPGGTLVFKWAGSLERVEPHFPAIPIVGNRDLSTTRGLGTRWIIFYKPLSGASDLPADRSEQLSLGSAA